MSGRDVEPGCFGGLFRKKRRNHHAVQNDMAAYKNELVPDTSAHHDEKVKDP